MYRVVEKARYIVFRNSNVVILYSNDFAKTLRQELEGYSEYIFDAAHGLAELER